MEDKVKITKDLKFDYQDLMREVDVSQKFISLTRMLRRCLRRSYLVDILKSNTSEVIYGMQL